MIYHYQLRFLLKELRFAILLPCFGGNVWFYNFLFRAVRRLQPGCPRLGSFASVRQPFRFPHASPAPILRSRNLAHVNALCSRSVAVIGRFGTRLWPLSRSQFLKQFLALTSEYTMLLEPIGKNTAPAIAAAALQAVQTAHL